MTDLDYLKLSNPQKMLVDLRRFFAALPGKIGNGLKNLVIFVSNFFKKIGSAIVDVFRTFVNGDWKTKVSYFVMGFGSCARGQWGRGILFFLFQTLFNFYMFNPDASQSGLYYLGKLSTLGTVETHKEGRRTVYGDNSFFILLYGVLTIFFIIAFIYTWYTNIRQNKISEEILKSGHKLKVADG